MPQLLTNPKGLEGFTRYHENGTNLPLYYRHEGNVEVYVRFLDGNTKVSPITCLDADAYAALADDGYHGVLLNEVRHQSLTGPISGNSEELKEIASGRVAATSTASAVDQLLKKRSLVDGGTFTTPALILGLCLLGSAVLYLIGRLKSRE